VDAALGRAAALRLAFGLYCSRRFNRSAAAAFSAATEFTPARAGTVGLGPAVPAVPGVRAAVVGVLAGPDVAGVGRAAGAGRVAAGVTAPAWGLGAATPVAGTRGCVLAARATTRFVWAAGLPQHLEWP